jgi:hypothetical protein
VGSLFDFLQRNQIQKADALPLVHSTEAYFLKKFMKANAIKTSKCKVFKSENLSYFFVGRPAFKRKLDSEAEYWELPICFVVQYKAVRIKRAFPFDSGAFKDGKYPHFISMMDIGEFEVSGDGEAAEKIIGTFFGDKRSYFHLKGRGRTEFESKFDVEMLDEEIKALHKLIEFKDSKLDDRRFSIEVQTAEDVLLNKENLIAAIIPESYLADDRVIEFFEDRPEVVLDTYPLYPLKKDYYYYAIYEKVENIMRRGGFFGV